MNCRCKAGIHIFDVCTHLLFQIVHTTCVHKNFGTEHKSEIILQFEVIEVLQNIFTFRRLFKEGIHYLMQSKSNLLVDIYNI